MQTSGEWRRENAAAFSDFATQTGLLTQVQSPDNCYSAATAHEASPQKSKNGEAHDRGDQAAL